MKSRDEKRLEILNRLNAVDELLRRKEASSDPAENERLRKLKNEIEKEMEINRGWFGASA